MIGTPPDNFQQHLLWLNNLIENRNRVILIVTIDSVDIGMITFYDFNVESKSVEFGWYIGDSSYIGKGYGKKIMQLILKCNKLLIRADTVRCVVNNENKVAIKIYNDCGFILSSNDGEFSCLEYRVGE